MDTLARRPVSPSGSSSDSNEDNSSSARVYFGPMQSPEKKFLAQEEARQSLQVPLSPSPLRRSPRFSGVPPSTPQQTTDPNEDIDNAVEDSHIEMANVAVHISRDATPDLDPLRQDEPSSSLARRILRAHDNPSPPPHLLPDNVRSPLRALSASPDPVKPFQGIDLLHTLPQAEGDGPAETSKELESSPCNVSQPDLISFDSCSTPIPGPPMDDDKSLVSRTQPPQASTETIDDLLLGSPTVLPPSPNTFTEGDIPKTPPAIPARSHQCESSSSATQLDGFLAPLSRFVTSVANEGAPSPDPHALPRRSSRKSTSPLKRPLLDESNTPSTANAPSREGSPTDDKMLIPSDSEPTRVTGLQVKNIVSESDHRPKGTSTPVTNFQRELGSLSPTSQSLLASLLPSASSNGPSLSHQDTDIRPLPPTAAPDQPDPKAQPPQSPLSRLTPVFRPPTSPQRLSTPSRLPPSPLKFSFTRDDVTRTPARRVPIQEALAQGMPSVQKPTKLFSRTALDDPSRTPAKRIPIIDLDPSPDAPSFHDKTPARARSASVEPKPSDQGHPRSRSVEPSPLTNRKKDKMLICSTTRRDSKLPFPLIASLPNGLHPPIPEEVETSDQTLPEDLASSSKPTRLSSPAKSSLKQPTVSSRIPRMDIKPYAKPKAKVLMAEGSSFIKSKGTTPVSQPSRIGTPGSSGSGSSSDSGRPPSTNGTAKSSTLTTLKRKRETLPSAPDTQPLRMRQVVPGMFGGKYAAKPQQSAAQTEMQAPRPSKPSPSKPAGPLRMRKVVDGMFVRGSGTEKVVKERPAQTPSSQLPTSGKSIPPTESSEVEARMELDTAPSPINAADVPPDIPPETSNSDGKDGQPDQTSDMQSNDAPAGIRRTSRARKPVLPPTADVFSSGTTRAPAPRKRALRSEGDGFMGLSAIALKALTNSNTEKNQRLITATLEMETIRKDGLRPESPTVKMRTIVQKQQEEQDRRRSERAERRARRSEEGSVASDIANSSDTEDGFVQVTEDPGQSRSKDLPKHRRGPGDEEDYETPEKIPRPLKRLKFALEREEVAERMQRQVKWDRGLSTTIYLDDIVPNPKSRPKEFTISKGCLASESKNRRLDTMGNLMDAENTPLTDLEPVNVVVKKFVYDNDLEAEPEPTPPPPPPKTRSRSKKAKS
ncbi:hypothetical protein CONPUDRAFT_150038 [Coniophora puteana RWD-64-598 SS2]|uniref:Uncharacterized protein n=1 Tax=Coniophora puteana (strain RWD-64-598) TaxID=741705 RepID=A0A5M3N2G0_CONPW|nr:uncharacterized protein CONPUDRAFT_150038 [Coniophora puteana RWD-64-598 SS2]EIW85204.1 hypothetical protein CONPUDRAFT_150038 [Coniophora puteana RWD-64-598 SS2]